MNDNLPPEESLADEFRNLGKNLADALRAGWESPERKRLQQEIESGLTDLGATLKREVDNFASSPTGQQLKTDVEQLHERVRSGETQEKVRQELLNALKTANAELQRVINQWSAPRTDASQNETPSEPTDKAG